MNKYIDAEKIPFVTGQTQISELDYVRRYDIDRMPAADVVSRGVLEQVTWERDLAVSQLAEIGKGLGEKMDDVQEVRHGRWEHYLNEGLIVKCSVCGSRYVEPWNYCPNCGSRMDLDGDTK